MPLESVSKEDFNEVRDDVKAILKYFNGNGNGTPGVFIRLDRLESFKRTVESVTRWLMGILTVETIALIGFGIALLTHQVSIKFGP